MGEGFWRDLVRNLAIAAAAGVFLAIVGALGMGEAPLWRRLLYWVPLMLIGALFGGAIAGIVMRLSPRARGNAWLLGALVSLAVAVLSVGFIFTYTSLFWRMNIPPAAWPAFFGTVLVMSIAMTAIMVMANHPGVQTHARAPGAPPQPIRFLERMPAKLKGATLYALEAEDHYLRLHTSTGSDLILVRLADAIGELEGVEGAQTHRSWWVAKDAVETVERDGAKVTLLLRGGVRAPVSRPNIRALKEAGWF
ncbi:MAG: LytTR family transcriptional regulator DNA-binding domain-containing protein [Hyphomonadaceae bacterium]